MNENTSTKDWVVKILVIIGFIATIILLLWAGTVAIKKLSPTFANLASVAEFKDDYKPVDELSIAVDKTVVNSEESFQISWTDMQQTGEFKLNYECGEGVTLLVRGESGDLKRMQCTDTLTLPATVHGLFLSIDSKATRFTDVEFSIAFVSSQKEITHVANSRITVVNAEVVPGQEIAGENTEIDDQDEQDTPNQPNDVVTQTPPPTQVPTYQTVYPESNPYGYSDLKTTILGMGEVRSGTFVHLAKLDPEERNAVKFDVENIGTKTSGSWTFRVTLPDGTKFRSESQSPLKPQEHAEFVLQFNLDDVDEDDKYAEVEVEVSVTIDANRNNNSADQTVRLDH